jgi:aminocarboxymuconate-semialdehyde decarboxylase
VPGRREFLEGTVAFVGCSLLGAAQAQTGKPARREVLVSGKRVKTIDVHAHCAIPEAMALMGMKVTPPSLVMGEERLRAMDEQGVDMAALSVNPYWYKAERDLAESLIKLQNESSPSCARRNRIVSSASPRSRSNIRLSPRSSSRKA